MMKLSKELLESIVNLKSTRQNDFDTLHQWIVYCHDQAEKIMLETPKSENVFTHWVSLGNVQVYREILDLFDNTEDMIMKIKLGGR